MNSISLFTGQTEKEIFDNVVSRFYVSTNNGARAMCKCPCHNDKKSSLTISIGDKGIMLRCHAGCDTADILDRVGLTFKDLFFNSTSAKGCSHSNVTRKTDPIISKPIEAPKKLSIPSDYMDKYDFVDIATGEYLYTKFRRANKKFVIGYMRLNGKYQGIPKDIDTSRAVYTRSQRNVIEQVNSGGMVVYSEGEKDCKSLARLGYTSITCGGCGTFRDAIIPYLQGCFIVIFADNDDKGINDAQGIKKAFLDAGMFAVTVIPPVGNKQDITDFIEDCKADGLTRDVIKEKIDALIVNAIHAAGD